MIIENKEAIIKEVLFMSFFDFEGGPVRSDRYDYEIFSQPWILSDEPDQLV